LPFDLSSRSLISIPYGLVTKRAITGAVSTLNPKEILNYDRQTGLNGLIQGRVPGMFGSSNIRGYGEPLYVVDGIVRPLAASILNVNEIDQVTVLKDLSSSMMYGSQAANGVVLITTKRGEPLKKHVRFTAEAGQNRPISYPKYLSSGDYMGLYNEALANDGLAPKYPAADIDSTIQGVNPTRFPDEEYYNSTYLKDFSSYQNVNAEVSGGNATAQFYLNVGWMHSNGLLKVGEGANQKSDKFNIRGNINYNLTDKIKLTYDGAVLFNTGKGPRYTSADFWTMTSTFLPNYYQVLIPVELMKDKALLGAAKLVDGKYLLGGTSQYQTNVYGELAMNGRSSSSNRLIEMTTGLDFDLNFLTEGLKATTYFSFDMYSSYNEALSNSYAVYSPVYTGDVITKWNKYKTDVTVVDPTVYNAYFYRKFSTFGTLEYHKNLDKHKIDGTAIVHGDKYDEEGLPQPIVHLQFGIRGSYMYMKKYIAELTGVYAGSRKLYGSKEYAFSPGIGLSWIMSEESFLKDNSFVDYLKISTNWAQNQTDERLLNSIYYSDKYAQGTSYYYTQGTSNNPAMVLSRGNSGLGWEKIRNFNLGFESLLFDSKIGLEGSFFYRKYYDVVTNRTNTLPVYFGNLPYENYGSNQHMGMELGLNYFTTLGKVELKVGGNFVYSVPKTLVVDELNYADDYRKATGKPTDAMFGYVALGLFENQGEIAASPLQTFGAVQPGDIKYADLNHDNIVDDLDQQMIGNYQSRFQYSFNLNLKYKGFELFALGIGQTGQDRYFNNSYYWVYGTRKYSEEVQNRWTPATAATATYPRLSSTSNENNFRNSTYWLYENNYFILQTTQLSYNFKIKSLSGLNGINLFLRGVNLAKISKIKDKTDLNIGSDPQMRSVSLGLSLIF
jgi:TonB-linked SusC/RagA family outer membrane protein